MNANMEKRDEFIRFIKWITLNQTIWQTICSDEALEPETCLEIIRELEVNGFYILIPVIIENSKNNYLMDKALFKFILTKLTDYWQEQEMSTILTELKEALQHV